jgi:hypothetical protein
VSEAEPLQAEGTPATIGPFNKLALIVPPVYPTTEPDKRVEMEKTT